MCFPGGSEVKASASTAGDLGSIPGSGRSPREGNDNPLQDSCLENLMDRSLAGYSPWVHKEEAACRAVFGTWGFFPTMHGKTALKTVRRLQSLARKNRGIAWYGFFSYLNKNVKKSLKKVNEMEIWGLV